MADIRTFLEKIKSAIYGKDVRQAIADAIRCCYMDGRAGSTDIEARDAIEQMRAEVNKGLVSGSYFCTDLADINQAILAEVAKMSVDSMKTVGVRLDFNGGLHGAGRLTIYLGQDASSNYVANAELVTTEGYHLFVNGYVSAGALINEMVFTDWEWANPPTDSTDKAYRTTERHMGMPVYVRRMEFKGSVTKSFNTDRLANVVSLSGIIVTKTFGSDDRVSGARYQPHRDANAYIGANAFRGADNTTYSVSVTVDIGTSLSEDDYLEVIVKYTM